MELMVHLRTGKSAINRNFRDQAYSFGIQPFSDPNRIRFLSSRERLSEGWKSRGPSEPIRTIAGRGDMEHGCLGWSQLRKHAGDRRED